MVGRETHTSEVEPEDLSFAGSNTINESAEAPIKKASNAEINEVISVLAKRLPVPLEEKLPDPQSFKQQVEAELIQRSKNRD